jgi:hypothetical protein
MLRDWLGTAEDPGTFAMDRNGAQRISISANDPATVSNGAPIGSEALTTGRFLLSTTKEKTPRTPCQCVRRSLFEDATGSSYTISARIHGEGATEGRDDFDRMLHLVLCSFYG